MRQWDTRAHQLIASGSIAIVNETSDRLSRDEDLLMTGTFPARSPRSPRARLSHRVVPIEDNRTRKTFIHYRLIVFCLRLCMIKPEDKTKEC